MNTICLDSSGWIEITHAGANAKKFSKVLHGDSRIVISTISLFEVAKYTTRVADEATAKELVAFLQQYEVVPVSSEIATEAANLGILHKLAMADSLIYATALIKNATLWTQDADFKGLSQVKYFPKGKP